MRSRLRSHELEKLQVEMRTIGGRMEIPGKEQENQSIKNIFRVHGIKLMPLIADALPLIVELLNLFSFSIG